MIQQELSFHKGKRKYLFCADSQGANHLYGLVHQTIEGNVPFDFHIIEEESDLLLEHWFSQQKLGTYLYLSGQWEFVNRVQALALEAGFSEYEMQINICGSVKKNVICSQCHAFHVVDDDVHNTCHHCGLELEVSDHYSRRLDAYLGYFSIK